MPETLLLLTLDERRSAAAVRSVMRDEDYKETDSAQTALDAVKKDPDASRLFVVSPEGEWCVVAEYGASFDVGLASAVADAAQVDGWLVVPTGNKKLELWRITAGQKSDEPQLLTASELTTALAQAQVPERLVTFAAKEHLADESVKQGKHHDIVLGFTAPQTKVKTEVARALAEPRTTPASRKTLSLASFLQRAVKHERVRAIALAQIEEQLRRDGFEEELRITNAQPEGHYCESFQAESHSFESNGPYNWFDWTCEEACEPRLAEEKAFPACDLRFRLETL